jgi:hypothetical protein
MCRILEGQRPEIPPEMDLQVANLLKKCWSENQQQRPQFYEILEDLANLGYKILPRANSRKVREYVDEIRRWENELPELPELPESH